MLTIHVLINFNLPILQLLALLLFLTTPAHIHTWDVAVSGDGGLSLLTVNWNGEFTGDGTPTEMVMESPVLSEREDGTPAEMTALAYDAVHQLFFFSVADPALNYSIYSYRLADNKTTPVMLKGAFAVEGLAYESSLQTLYWTDGNGHSIRRMDMSASNRTADIIFQLDTQVPQGIAVSHCHRAIFWANSEQKSPSVNRAELDGSKPVQIVTENLHTPLGVTVDETYGKVYWSDQRAGIYYTIDRCDLDGSEREQILRKTNQVPIFLALSQSTLFWSDRLGKKIWSLSVDMTFPNRTHTSFEPQLLTSLAHQPHGLAVFTNASISCEPIKELRSVFEPPPKEEYDFNPSAPQFCLNGEKVARSKCRCKNGFTGKRCEIPACYQHCLNSGKCYLNSQGYPECDCPPGYQGTRCEKDVCFDYCLAGGRCSLEAGQPTCQCQPGTSGQRCEVMSSMLSLVPQPHDLPILAGLAAVASTLLVVVLVLAWRVCVLRRRPRVKKRYIVNKRFRSMSGSTPTTQMTCRPPASPAVEQCEITIENCCNMNICETPCFEPNVRTNKSTSHKKAEDRRNLLANMEEPGGSD